MAKKRKARFPKGSPQAKAWGKKMAAARKKCDTAYSKASSGKKKASKRKAEHKGRKKPRSAAQKAATARMLAANKKAHPKHKKAKKTKHKSEHRSEHKTEHKRKKPRTAAQKAATARMVAANKRARKGERGLMTDKEFHKTAAKARGNTRKARRQAAVLGAFRGGPRGGIRVAPHPGNARCTICHKVHDQREHYSHKRGPHNIRTGTEHAYFTTAEHIKANPKAPLRVKPPKTIKEAQAIAALERKAKKPATFIGPIENRAAKKSRKAWQAWRNERTFIGPRRASGSIH